jgi:serine/threonine-protein kinase
MPPEKFGRYEVLAELGDGAMGRVYKAWDPGVQRVVAVKTVKREYLSSDTAAEYLRRFRNEAIAAGRLTHPGIVRVYDVDQDFLVMEYIEGRTLQALLRERGRLPPGEVSRLLAPVAEAIDAAHRQGIVHRDVKPANIMVQADGQPKLMDFGVAKLETSVMTTSGQILGSPSYMSPEQIAGHTVTGRSDVYSLAVVAYELLTGQPPFQGKTITQVIYRVMHDKAPPPRQLNAALPHRYDDVFAQALHKEPAARFESASAFVAALELRDIEEALAPPPYEDVDTEQIVLTSEQADEVRRTAAGLASRPGATPAKPAPPAHPHARTDARAVSRWPLVLGAVALAAAAGAGLWLRERPTEPEAAPPPTPSPLASPSLEPLAGDVAPPLPIATPTVAPTPGPASATGPKPARPARPTPKPAVAAAAPAPTPVTEPMPTPTPVVEGQLVEIGPGVKPPRKISGPTAEYPERARRLRLEGTVSIRLVIDENGLPSDLEVTESAGSLLDEATLAAVRKWRFEPAEKDGVRVKVRWMVRQTYQRAR